MSSVSLRRIVKTYGPARVLDDVSLEIADREFVVLVGPSGCGKSTLLRMIAGLEEITSGEVLIGGEVVNRLPPQRRNIAMVFQSYALYPHMTVYDNIAFGLRQRQTPRPEIDGKVRGGAEILNLGQLLARYPRQLSGGQRQRVAMGRALVRDPRVFLFDEPLSNLDAQLRVQMRTEIKALHNRLHATTVYVTHDQIEAMTMADRIVVLNRGRIEQIGTPLELYDQPANTFVAQFIGSPQMNLLNATIRRDGGAAWAVAEAGGRLPVPQATLRDGQAVVYGVRPEHLRIAAPGEPAIEGHVIVTEPTGRETQIFADIAGAQICALTPGRDLAASGTPIALTPDPAHAHLFDAGTGARL